MASGPNILELLNTRPFDSNKIDLVISRLSEKWISDLSPAIPAFVAFLNDIKKAQLHFRSSHMTAHQRLPTLVNKYLEDKPALETMLGLIKVTGHTSPSESGVVTSRLALRM